MNTGLNTGSNTGSPRSSSARTTLRVVGAVLLVAGLVVAFIGGRGTARAFSSESMDPELGSFFLLAAGLFMVVFGLGALNAGFLGAQARYAADETAPALRTAGSAWRGDAAGCPQCGAVARPGARFCDACGHGIG